jgi:hypothetical protein
MNLPLKRLVAMGSGTGSSFISRSAITSLTSVRIPPSRSEINLSCSFLIQKLFQFDVPGFKVYILAAFNFNEVMDGGGGVGEQLFLERFLCFDNETRQRRYPL